MKIMAQHWNREMLDMLKDAGAKELPHGGGHLKFRLPNGHMFVTAKTPSDTRGVLNDLSRLRRELRDTHPEIANRGQHNRRTTTNTIGEIIAVKTVPMTPYATNDDVFGGPMRMPIQVPPQRTLEAEVIRNHEYHPSLKVHRDPPPKPGPVKTLLEQQLRIANQIELSEGHEAMTRYLNKCHDEGLVDYKPGAVIPTTITAVQSEDKQMSEILDRAKRELAIITARLAGYAEKIAALRSQEEEDGLKRIQLEEYIAKHEALAIEAAALLSGGLLPPEKVRPLQVIKAPQDGKRKSPVRGLYRDFNNFVVPALKAKRKEFNGDIALAEFRNLPGYSAVSHKQVSNMLTYQINIDKDACYERFAYGWYRFKEAQEQIEQIKEQIRKDDLF